jgi:HD superfamily phosphohydrolase
LHNITPLSNISYVHRSENRLNSSSLEDIAILNGDLSHGVDLRHKPKYDLYDDRMEIFDPVYGHEVIDEPVLVALARSDALRRLQTVEQLTLPDRYKTVPNSTFFSRWEHVWGTAILAKRIGHEMALDPQEVINLQLRSVLSDVCHTAHSHAGDWILQGIGEDENHHDLRLQSYAEVVGISDLLRRYKIEPSDVLVERRDGIVNAKMPDLDIDRVDYTLREAYRWVNQIPEFRQLLNSESFTVKDDRLIMKDQLSAKLFGISYTLLVTEHWQEPVHRLQLELFIESIRRVFIARHGLKTELGSYSPADLMMTTDDVLQQAAAEPDDYMHMLDELMCSVSSFEAGHRWDTRADRVRTALETGIHGNGEPITWLAARYDDLPRAYEIEPEDQSAVEDPNRMHKLELEILRKRYVDPLYINEGGEVVRLSDEDPSFSEYMDTALGRVQKQWRALIIGNRASTMALKNFLSDNNEKWPCVMQRPNMPNDLLRERLRRTIEESNGAAGKFLDFSVHM